MRSDLRRRRPSLTRWAAILSACSIIAACGSTTVVSPTPGPRAADRAGTAVSTVDAVRFLSPTVGWVATDHDSRLMRTTDGGRRWTNVSPPALRRHGRIIAGGLSGAFFLSRSDVWVAVFNNGPDRVLPVQLLHTANGGRTWTDRGSFPRAYGDAWIYFVSRSRGWLMVGHGQAADQESVSIYETRSAGRRWRELARSSSPMTSGTPGAPSAGCDKTGISYSGSSSGWISGNCSGALELQHSRDGGRVWHEVGLSASQRPFSGAYANPPTFSTTADGALDAGLATATGTYDAVYATTDGGSSWTLHRPPSPSKGPMDVVSATAWFIAHGRTLYLTTNAGARWTGVRSSIALDGRGTDTLDFVNSSVGWTVTAAGKLWHTTDGGHTWKTVSVHA